MPRDNSAVERAKRARQIITPPKRGVKYSPLSLDWFSARMQGGKQTFLEYVKRAAHDEPELQKFLEFWNSLRVPDQQKTTFDEVCDSCGLTRKFIMSRVVAEALEYGNQGAAVTIAQGLPDVAHAAVESAKTRKGFKDREMLFTATGILPTPKGTTINLQQNQFGRPPEDNDLPSFDDTIMDASVSHDYLPALTIPAKTED